MNIDFESRNITRRSFLKAAGVTTAVAAVSLGAPAASACYPGSFKDITILYTNDVHTYIDKKSPELTYAAIAALKKSYQDAGKNVLLVDAGDHIQGTAYGSMDEGASIIQLMNAAGYDVATPGNHEFDYGMARAKEVMAEADFPYLSSNWVNLPLGNRVLPDVKYFTIGGRVIAFVGITTPETFTKSTPAYFMDKSQSRYIYDILGGDDGQKLYKAVQKSIDKAKVLADYVIGLGHLGVDPSSSPWTSEEVIAHTSGFDAFIDGHSHTVMENKQVQDASGKAVTLTQTGSYFANVGEMTIAADGTITTKLIPTHEGMDAGIAAMQTGWVNTVDDMLGEKIAVGDSDFYVSDPATGKRRIRSGETNLGDFVADENAEAPGKAADRAMVAQQINQALKSLTPREEKVIRLRFGLDDGRPRTLEEVGRDFGVTRERVRQIEAKAIRKLHSRKCLALLNGLIE